MSSPKKAPENIEIDPLGLDYNYNIKKMAGKQSTPKDVLKVYFLTVRLRVNFSHENALELVTCLKVHKLYKQILFSIEKENAVGPCTHHVHAIILFTQNVPNPTFKQWMDRFIMKHFQRPRSNSSLITTPKQQLTCSHVTASKTII